MNDEDAKATRVGAVVLVVIALAVAAVLTLQDRHLRSGITLHVDIKGTGNLVEGSRVRVGGMTIGDLEAVRFGPDGRVVFDLWIEARRAWLIRQNSEVFVNQSGFIGEPYLEIGPHRSSGGRRPLDGQSPSSLPRPELPPDEPGAPVADGDTLRGVDPPKLDELVRTSFESMNAVGDAIRTGFPEIAILQRQIAHLETTLASLEPTPGALITSWRAQKRLFGEVRALLATVNQSGFKLDDARRLGEHADRTLAHAREQIGVILARAEKLQPAVHRLVAVTGDPRLAALSLALDEVTAITQQIDHTLATLAAIRELVARGEGTIGAIMADAELANEFKEMSKTLKRQPWRAIGHPDKGAKPK